jgi:CRP-like cAMP-binding protein
MNEVKDRQQLQTYLQTYQMEHIINQEVMPYLSLVKFEKGESICRQGELSQKLFFLVKGKLKIYQSSVEGKTLILSFKTPLEVIGDIEYVQGIETINTVEAVSQVEMIVVSYDKLKQHVHEHAPFLQFLLQVITKKFYLKSNSKSLNIMYPVEVRFVSYLLSVTDEENDVKITTSLSDISNLIGTSYRHLNRVILKLSEDGFIERKEKAIFIKDRKALKLLAGNNIYE